MVYRHLSDMHIHSDNSKDADHSVTLICEKAIEKGLRAIAITDHCDCITYNEFDYKTVCRQSAFETRKARSVFEGQIVVFSGVEIGSPLRDLDAANDVMKNDFDFCLASVHRIKGKKKSMSHLDFTREDNAPEKIMQRYFEELLETVEWDGCDVLSHMTYPLRYYPPEMIADYDIWQHREVIDAILSTLAKNRKALEINTGGGEYVTKTVTAYTHPSIEIVKRFRELGGRYITVGSDAHNAYSVGNGCAEAMEMAAAAGFEHITVYEKRIPMQIKIQ